MRFGGGIYFLPELEALHGQQVNVAYDFRDASRVWVHTLDGELVGEALLGGNASPAMPQSLLDKAGEKREQGQLARLVRKAKTLTGQDVELHVVPKAAPSAELSAEALENASAYAALAMQAQAAQFEVPSDAMARYRLWQQLQTRQQAGETLTEDEAKWHSRDPAHPDFASIQRMYDQFAAAEQARA